MFLHKMKKLNCNIDMKSLWSKQGIQLGLTQWPLGDLALSLDV